ncbi:hypothetical protein [Nesterenkonia populi]
MNDSSRNFVVHIGTQKTGTTFIQGILSQNRPELVEAGWRYPGARLNQQHAVYGLFGDSIEHIKDASIYSRIGADLQDKVHSNLQGDRNVIISSEILSELDDNAVDEFVNKLGRPSRVVLTLRGLHSLLPSIWQQSLKTGSTEALPDMIARAMSQASNPDKAWRAYAFGEVVRRWARWAPVHVVVVPGRGSKGGATLWDLFRDAAGLPEVTQTTVPDSASNLSLSHESAQLMRQMNCEVKAGRISKEEAEGMRKAYLNMVVFPLAGGADGGSRITLPSEFKDDVARWNEEQLQILQGSASSIHGSLEDARWMPDKAPVIVDGEIKRVAAKQLMHILEILSAKSS